jgi:5-methylcytosine-specific restriction endonuclease McrA
MISEEERRKEALVVLGGQCIQCQCQDARCLQIDHIIPLQGKRRVAHKTLYLNVLRGKTENLQVLCANCHAIKTYHEDGERCDG